MRYSRQREMILQEVRQRNDHPTADEIYTSLREGCPGLSLGTVYRNLNSLVEMGSVRRVEIPGQADRFDHTLAPHTHLYCRCCGQVVDVAVNTDLLNQALDLQKVQVEQYALALYGVCSQCTTHH